MRPNLLLTYIKARIYREGATSLGKIVRAPAHRNNGNNTEREWRQHEPMMIPALIIRVFVTLTISRQWPCCGAGSVCEIVAINWRWASQFEEEMDRAFFEIISAIFVTKTKAVICSNQKTNENWGFTVQFLPRLQWWIIVTNSNLDFILNYSSIIVNLMNNEQQTIDLRVI